MSTGKYSYYYEEQLIRTSDHEYTHAVLDQTGKCIACRNGLQNAEKALNEVRRPYMVDIKNLNEKLAAIKDGRIYYTLKYGRNSWHVKLQTEDTEASVRGRITDLQNQLGFINRHYRIVELEKKLTRINRRLLNQINKRLGETWTIAENSKLDYSPSRDSNGSG